MEELQKEYGIDLTSFNRSGLDKNEFSRERINFTLNELEEERAAVADMVK